MKHSYPTPGRLRRAVMVMYGWLSLFVLAGAHQAAAQTYLMDNTPVTACSGTFYDSGGAGANYGNNQNFTKVFSPGTPGGLVRLSFSSFSVENTGFFGQVYDAMTIYDGPSTAAAVIGTYYGTNGDNAPGTITATNPTGQLTVRFTSDGEVTRAGWEATVSCVASPYYPMSNAPVTACSGTFTDSNPFGNYSNNQSFTKTFSPATAGAAVQLDFTSFALEVGSANNGTPYDYLDIYDGPTTSAPLIGRYSGNNSPGTVRASNATGQLTARFISDVGVTRAGWEADISCIDPVAFAPASGSPGTSVLLSGGQLSTVTEVRFNGTPAFFYYNSATGQIRASVPTGASSGPVQLVRASAAGTVSSQASFTVCGTQAVARAYTALLDAEGIATATPANVDNGSTSTCGSVSTYFLDATELFVNGTFTGSAAGWTPANINTANVPGAGGYLANAGNPGGAFSLNDGGQANTDPSLSQTVNGLTAGATYLVQGDYRDYFIHDNSEARPVFSVDINGASVLTRTNPGAIWTHFAYVLTVPAGQTARTFRFRAEIDGTDVDIVVDNLSLRRLFSTASYTCANAGANSLTLVALNPNGDVSTAAATVTVAAPVLTSTTWLGTVGTDWNNCRNWSFGKVPSATIDAVVPAGLGTYPSISSGTIAARNLTVNGSLTLGSAATLEVSGSLLYNSPAALGGTLVFTSGFGPPVVGPAPGPAGVAQTIGGGAPLTVNNLFLQKISGSVQLLQNVTVTGSLQLATGPATTGLLETGSGYAVTLGPAATITETETAYVTGTVRTTRPVAVGSAQPFGGLGLTLTPAAGSVAPGSTEVVRTTGEFLKGLGTSQSIRRYFQVTPAASTGVNATLVFSYFEHERNDILEADLRLFRNATAGPAGWIPQLSAAFNLTANTATLTGTTVLGFWTLGSAANPLPVQLTRFEAAPAGAHAVRLSWATAQELNSADFVVERSLDGRRFEPVGTVAAAGTSSSARHYTLLDTQLPTGAALLYYRLRQNDLDGKVARSEVRTVSLSAAAALTLAPNPTQGVATLRGAAATVPVQVLDATGRLVLSTTTDASGTATLALPATLPRGLYVVRAGSHTTRLVLE